MITKHLYSVYIPYSKTIHFLGSYESKNDAINVIKISDSFESCKNLSIWFQNYEDIYLNIKNLFDHYLSDIGISYNRFIDSIYNDRLADEFINFESAKETVLNYKYGYTE